MAAQGPIKTAPGLPSLPRGHASQRGPLVIARWFVRGHSMIIQPGPTSGKLVEQLYLSTGPTSSELRQHLDCHFAIQLGVCGAIHLAHSTLTMLGRDFVVGDGRVQHGANHLGIRSGLQSSSAQEHVLRITRCALAHLWLSVPSRLTPQSTAPARHLILEAAFRWPQRSAKGAERNRSSCERVYSLDEVLVPTQFTHHDPK